MWKIIWKHKVEFFILGLPYYSPIMYHAPNFRETEKI